MLNLNRYRKKMFVSGRIQGRLMFRIGLYWVLYHVVLWHALFVYRYVQYRMTGMDAGNAVPFQELYGQFVIDYYPVILCAAITLPVVVIDMLHMTHRVAGPLIRFQNALKDLVDGKPVESVSLRKGDLLTEFQDEFNQYLAVLARERRQLVESETADGMNEDEANLVSEVAELSREVQSATAPQRDATESTIES